MKLFLEDRTEKQSLAVRLLLFKDKVIIILRVLSSGWYVVLAISVFPVMRCNFFCCCFQSKHHTELLFYTRVGAAIFGPSAVCSLQTTWETSGMVGARLLVAVSRVPSWPLPCAPSPTGQAVEDI